MEALGPRRHCDLVVTRKLTFLGNADPHSPAFSVKFVTVQPQPFKNGPEISAVQNIGTLQQSRLCRTSMDLESPAEVGGDNGAVYFFFLFGLSVAPVKREHILGCCFPSTTEGRHQRQDLQGRKSTARPEAAGNT